MDTLHVFNQQTSGSRHSSRTPSPSRYAQAELQQQQMSRDRESSDSSAVAATGTVNPSTNIRYRNQSPSARRSRERERSDKDQTKEIIIAQSTLNSSDMTGADHMDAFDDSRVSGDDMIGGYPSFGSDELDLQYGDMDNRQLLLQQYQQQQQSTPQNRHHRTNSLQAIDRLTTKIACTKESIRREQTARDDNVNEYLKLAASADKQQLSRIKAVFEKKNQKSAHNISQLQKKLESYNKRYKDVQIQQNLKLQQQIQQQKDHRKPGEVLRDVGQGLRNVGGNIRDGVTGLSATVMSKPREFAHLLKNKFGSADNINQLSSTWYTDPDLQELNLQTEGHTTGHGHGHAHVSSNNLGGGGGSSGKFNSEHDSECSSVTSDSNPGGLFLKCKNTGSGSGGGGGAGSGDKIASQQQQCPISIKSLLAEIQERKEDCDKLKERIERLESNQKEFESLTAAFESERFRAENLIEQMNDMQELHQTEIENLKQAMADMEEKVQYQSDERLRDINEVLENCQTRISKMEHMSQQIVTVEGIDNSNARALIVKLINVVLTVLQVILLLVATGAGILMPFLKTRVRVLTTFFFVLLIIFIFRSWPDFRDIGSHMVKRLRDVLVK